MAEFVEVIKKRKEMCSYYESCSKGCPFLELRTKHSIACVSVVMNYPEEAEAVIMNWEKPIDWSKVEVDTKILVKTAENNSWYKRHFAKYENGKVYAWADGTTSFTVMSDDCISAWDFTKLAEDGEQNE